MIRSSPTTGPVARRKPRASGDDPVLLVQDSVVIGVNPARAGMILSLSMSAAKSPSKPRASGDDPVLARRALTTMV